MNLQCVTFLSEIMNTSAVTALCSKPLSFSLFFLFSHLKFDCYFMKPLLNLFQTATITGTWNNLKFLRKIFESSSI